MKMKEDIKMKSLSSLFKTNLFVLETYVVAIEQLHNSCNVNEIKSYQGIILRRIVNSLKTMDQMLAFSKDPISAYSLLRTIADSICAYCFIYENENIDEVEFRHFLFLLDGCSQFVNAFPAVLINNEQLEKTEYEINQTEISQERTNLVDFQKQLLLYIQNTPIVLTMPKETEEIIRNRDWKYRSILPYLKKDSFSWLNIYEKAGADVNFVNILSTFLSQYVHGLFLSNTKNPSSKVHYTLIYDVAITLERRLISAIIKCFKEDNVETLMLNHIDLNKMADLDIDRKSLLSYFRDKI